MTGALAVNYVEPTRFARYTCTDALKIPKYTILQLISPNTASACSADNQVCAGIAYMTKGTADGGTEIVAALDGVWGLKAGSGAITVGNRVAISDTNEIKAYTTLDDEKGYTMGKALETTNGYTTIKVRLDL